MADSKVSLYDASFAELHDALRGTHARYTPAI